MWNGSCIWLGLVSLVSPVGLAVTRLTGRNAGYQVVCRVNAGVCVGSRAAFGANRSVVARLQGGPGW